MSRPSKAADTGPRHPVPLGRRDGGQGRLTLSILGDERSIVDLLTRNWTWTQDRRDPVRAQAQRLNDAFEAQGIARQQIARVLTPEPAIRRQSRLRRGSQPGISRGRSLSRQHFHAHRFGQLGFGWLKAGIVFTE